jgi:hypothetical protein
MTMTTGKGNVGCQRRALRCSVNSNVHSHGVTIRGSTYFLASDIFSTYDMLCPFNVKMDNMKIEGIALLDLEKEQWWPATLQGPHEITSAHRCKLVELNNTLVLVIMVHLHFDHTYMDFWFADDLKKGLWVKKLVLRPKSREPCAHLPLVIDVRRELWYWTMAESYFPTMLARKSHTG